MDGHDARSPNLPWAGNSSLSPMNAPMLGDTDREEVITPTTPRPKHAGHDQDWASDVTDKTGVDAALYVRARRRGYTRTIVPWAAEIACCIAGIGCIAAITIILRQYDGKLQPDFPLHITINALIQFIATTGNRLILIAVGSAVGQLAWLAYSNRARPLLEFELHQNASQGGLAPFRLLWHLRFSPRRPLQWLAAVLGIYSFLVSTITQQAITIVSVGVPTPNGTALAFRATTLSRSNGTTFKLDPNDQFVAEEAILASAYLGPNGTVAPVDPQCSTGNCTWPLYGSISLCVDVANVTDPTHHANLGTYLKQFIQENAFLIGNLTDVYPAIVLQPFAPTGFLNASATQAAALELYIAFSPSIVANVTSGDVSSYNFFGVGFYFCTKAFMSGVTQGNTIVAEVARALDIASAPPGLLSVNSMWNPEIFPDPTCNDTFLGKSLMLRGAGALRDEAYVIDVCTAGIFSNLFSGIFYAAAFWGSDFSIHNELGAIADALGLSLFGQFGGPGNVADGVTNHMRKIGSSLPGSHGPAQGEAFLPQSIVAVRWEWVILLGLYVLLAAVLLVTIMFMTYFSGLEPFKQSILAAMLALGPELRDSLGVLGDSKVVTKSARATDVRLVAVGLGEGIEFVRSDTVKNR